MIMAKKWQCAINALPTGDAHETNKSGMRKKSDMRATEEIGERKGSKCCHSATRGQIPDRPKRSDEAKNFMCVHYSP